MGIKAIDPSIPSFIYTDNGTKLLLCYYIGLLPFMRIHHDVLAIPYMTRDYLKMKLHEAREKSRLLYLYILMITIGNMTINPMIEHLNKRGLFTNYWVINDEDEMEKIMKNTTV